MLDKVQIETTLILAQVRELARQQVELKVNLHGIMAHRKSMEPTNPGYETTGIQVDIFVEQLAFIDEQLKSILASAHSMVL